MEQHLSDLTRLTAPLLREHHDDHPEKYLDLAVAQTLRVAKEAGIKSMAMPAIGTGVFKFPSELAAQIIIDGLVNRSEEYSEILLVRICVGTQELKAVFTSTLEASGIPQNL
jgi:O-acetyl-ADP-ribose deacetylase (regulator of RNase III)